MSSSRPKSRRPKNKRHRRIPPLTRENAIMLREMGHTLKDICNKTQLSYGTVRDIINKKDDDPDMVKRARARALEAAANAAGEKASMALESITPDSLKHDRIEIRDAEGNLREVKHSGPTAMQNATTYGILTDKAIKLQDRAAEMRGERRVELSPDSIGELIGSLLGRIENIENLNINIGSDLSPLKDKLADLQDKAVDAQFEEVDDESPALP